jgi:hypothetical protein
VRIAPRIAGLLAVVVSSAQGQPAPARWTVDAQPVLTIGQNEADTNAILAVVAGATRLPDGRILVGDRGSFNLRLFAPNGRQERVFGRKGSGPGEIEHLKSMLRCGDSIVTMDISGQRVSVFSLDGRFVRAFRFGSPQTARAPYASVCNDRGAFAHYGWEVMSQARAGAYRPDVPFWLSGSDTAVSRVVGSFPGSERFGFASNGRFSGGPLPLGKQPALALGSDRLYIGAAERYEVQVFDLTGKLVATIRSDYAPRAITDEDIEYAMELEIAENGERARAGIQRRYGMITFPKTAPAYAALRVDHAGNLWIQDYPRPSAPTVIWRVFSRDGASVSRVDLPTYLGVYEIGADYVLGRYLDPDESVPQVRLYRLRRAVR